MRRIQLVVIFAGLFTESASAQVAQSARARQDGVTITGRIFAAATKAPVPESHILIVERSPRGRVVRTVRTSSAGTYQATDVQPGSYLIARGRGYASKHVIIANTASAHMIRQFALDEAASLSGRIVDQLGVPISSATVRLAYAGDFPPFLIAADIGETQTDATGEFHVAHVNPGQRFFVEALSPLHPVAYSQPWILAPGQQQANVELVLRQGTQLRLVVRDAVTQRSLSNARILIRRRREAPQIQNSVGDVQTMQRSATTSTDGTLVFNGLAPGEHTVFVLVPGYFPERRLIQLHNAGPTTLQIELRTR